VYLFHLNKFHLEDVRYPSRPVYYLPRRTENCQRYYFDVLNGVVVTGSEDGAVYLFDVVTSSPIAAVPAHFAPCVGASFHPSLPLVLTCSGTRRYDVFDALGRDSDSDSDRGLEGVPPNDLEIDQKSSIVDQLRNCVRIWHIKWKDGLVDSEALDEPGASGREIDS